MNKYFIDTSAWIDYFKNRNVKLNDDIDKLLDENAVCINGIVKTEILLGTNNKKDYEYLNSNLDGLIFLEIDKDLFSNISLNGYILKKSGIMIPLSDLIIATQCNYLDLILIENDKHYKLVEDIIKIKRFFN